MMKRILVTGAAGFIGHALIARLLREDVEVLGIDNMNSYYDTALKYARLMDLGLRESDVRATAGEADKSSERIVTSQKHGNLRFARVALEDRERLPRLFEGFRPDWVVNLAGQAGVRYSIENPFAYAESNLLGFLNLLECCRHCPVEHLLYASSSSIYGRSDNVPYNEGQMTDSPVSLYAATKKSNELMAYAYADMYGIPSTGLRFFTVYGPWGRPDMAPFLFMREILRGGLIRMFNNGDMQRDFTYIDDIVEGVCLVMGHPKAEGVRHEVFNIGHSSPVRLPDFISTIEEVTGKRANIQKTGMQKGDVYCTFADTGKIRQRFGYTPQTDVKEGISRFFAWWREHVDLVDKLG